MAGTGRRERRPPEFWRELVAAQPGSGGTVAEFCAARGVGQAGFYAWRKRLAAAPGRAPKRRARAAAAGFAAVRVTADARPSAADARPSAADARPSAAVAGAAAVVEVALPGGTVLRAPLGVEVEAFARLAAALRGAGC